MTFWPCSRVSLSMNLKYSAAESFTAENADDAAKTKANSPLMRQMTLIVFEQQARILDQNNRRNVSCFALVFQITRSPDFFNVFSHARRDQRQNKRSKKQKSARRALPFCFGREGANEQS